MRVVGIDIGLGGAIGLLNDAGFVWVKDMPVIQVGSKSGRVRGQIMASAVRAILIEAEADRVIVEQVGPMPKQGVSSTFGFGHSRGLIEGVCAGAQIPYELVMPQVWKRKFGLLGKTKDASRELASRLFPTADLRLKKHDGRAESLLIAAYGGMQDGPSVV